MVERELDRLLADARRDKELKNELIKTRESCDPVGEFCALCEKLSAHMEKLALDLPEDRRMPPPPPPPPGPEEGRPGFPRPPFPPGTRFKC